MVDVKGVVNNPGVYEVDPGARIHDVIELAGDFTEEADETSVNLAEMVHDERMIVVPKIGDETDGTESGDQQATKIKINQATQAEIEQLPRSEEHTSELQSRGHLVCRLLLEKKKNTCCVV